MIYYGSTLQHICQWPQRSPGSIRILNYLTSPDLYRTALVRYRTVPTDMVLFQPIDGQSWIQDRWLQKVKNTQDAF